jgi:hydrogenase maturation protease
MREAKILVAGIGNIFLGDDGFGVEVLQRLLRRKFPESVRLVDYGIRGFDLAFALQDDYDVTILLDATSRGGQPGTLYTIEPDLTDLEDLESREGVVETHGMNPMNVLRMVKAMGGEFHRILLVGCEPATFGEDGQGEMGLSEPVEAAVDGAVQLVEKLIGDILNEAQYRAPTDQLMSQK